MKPRSTISFVVVTYQSRTTIAECLGSILHQEPRPDQVVVVDNASSDGTPDLVRAEFPEVELVTNQHNEGYGKANNAGAKMAIGDIVVFANPDVWLGEAWLREILAAFSADYCCGAVEGKILLAQTPSLLNCRGSYMNLLGFGCATGYGELDCGGDKIKRVSYPSGAAFAVLKRVFMDVGGFDETYFLYHEDVDLGIRLNAAGWRVLCAPTAVAYHHFTSLLSQGKIQLLERNRWITLVKNMPGVYFAKTAPLHVLSELALIAYLAMHGYLRAKMSAHLGFLRLLPSLLAQRQANRAGVIHKSRIPGILTSDFPNLVPENGRITAFARALLEHYLNAFFKVDLTPPSRDEFDSDAPKNDIQGLTRE